MAPTMRTLLALPPCLRQSMILERSAQFASNARHSLNASSSRTFTCSRNLLRPQNPPKPFRKGTRPQAPPTQHAQPPPSRPLPRSPSLPQNSSKIDSIAPGLDTVLLYTAPRHGGFRAVSYITGAIFLFGASNSAYTFLKDNPNLPKTPWYIKTVSTIPALFMSIMGGVCMLAPMKIIKSVAIITQNGARTLRFEIKRALPFMKPDVLETPISRVALDRNVPGLTPDLKIKNIKIEDAETFTENYFSKTKTDSQGGGARGALSSFNKSLLNAWPAAKREVRRMFMREHMAYVRVEGNGNFKLDLQECSVLEGGTPLEWIIETDLEARPSISSWIRRLNKAE